MKRVIRNSVEEPLTSIFGMANLYPKHTGLPVILWVDNMGSARNVQHNLPRLKVQNIRGNKRSEDTFSVSISKRPEILSGENKLSSKDWKAVKQFISDNYDYFIQHWNEEIDEYELKDLLTKGD